MFESKKLAEWIDKQTEVNESVADLLSGFMNEITELQKRVKLLEATHHNKRLLNGKTKSTKANS